MTDQDALKVVQDKIVECMNTAVKVFPELKEIAQPAIDIHMTGKCGGMHVWSPRTQSHTIRVNRVLLEENPKTSINQTTPHEVAHMIVQHLFGSKKTWTRGGYKRIVAPHGKEWKMVMGVLGVPAERCHNMDTSNASKLNTFTYKCETCGSEFNLTSIRHNKCRRRGVVYGCGKRGCQGSLKYKNGGSTKPAPRKTTTRPAMPGTRTVDFRVGDTVSFTTKRGQNIKAVVKRVNKKTCSVVDVNEKGERYWRVPPHMLNKVN